MGRRAGLDLEQVVDAAEAIADQEGLEHLTLSAVADRLEVRSPSLYHHLDGLPDLRRHLALRASRRLTEAIRRGIGKRRGVAAIKSGAAAYRSFALSHPGLHSALSPTLHPAPGAELREALIAPWKAFEEAVSALELGPERQARFLGALQSLLYGHSVLERTGTLFPGAAEQTFKLGIELLTDGLQEPVEQRGSPRS